MAQATGGAALAGRGVEVARLLAGLADVGLERAERLARQLREALGRNDYPDLAAEAHADLLARGDVLLARLGPGAEAHMEALARIARSTRDDLAGTGPGTGNGPGPGTGNA